LFENVKDFWGALAGVFLIIIVSNILKNGYNANLLLGTAASSGVNLIGALKD